MSVRFVEVPSHDIASTVAVGFSFFSTAENGCVEVAGDRIFDSVAALLDAISCDAHYHSDGGAAAVRLIDAIPRDRLAAARQTAGVQQALLELARVLDVEGLEAVFRALQEAS